MAYFTGGICVRIAVVAPARLAEIQHPVWLSPQMMSTTIVSSGTLAMMGQVDVKYYVLY